MMTCCEGLTGSSWNNESIYDEVISSRLHTIYAATYDSQAKSNVEDLQAVLDVFMIQTELVDRLLHFTLPRFNGVSTGVLETTH